MKAEQLEDILVLYRTKGLSRRDAGRLVQQVGRPEEVFALSAETLTGWG